MRWYETVDTTMVVEPVVTATSSGTIWWSIRPIPASLGLKIHVPLMRGISTLGRGKGRSWWEPPKGGGALGPDVWYPTIPGSPEEKDQGSLIQPRRGGGVHPLLTKRPIFIVRLEARERKKDRLGEGVIVIPTNWGHRQVRPHMNYPWNRHASHRKAYPGVERSKVSRSQRGTETRSRERIYVNKTGLQRRQTSL